MATQKNSKSTKVSASKGKPAKSAVKKTVTKAAPKRKAATKPAPAKKATSKKAPVSKAKKTAPVAKKVAKKPAPKPVAKPAPKQAAHKPAPAKAKAPAIKKQAEVKAKTIGKPTVKLAPKVAIKKPELKVVAPKKVITPIPAPKPVTKPTGSKSSDLSRPAVSSKPRTEKQPEPKPKEVFQRSKPFKPSAGYPAKPHDIMSDKKDIRTVAATYPEEPHKTRYSDKELEEFDQLIDQKLIVAREQLEFYLKQLEDMAENPDNKIKGLDDGLSTLESERVSSMAARQQKLIQHLENAKIRIKNKVYGICRETGKLISKERLRAVPHATLSIEAKQAQN